MNNIINEYEKRVVFFIDVLAFKNLIKTKTVNEIKKILDEIKDLKKEDSKTNSIKVTTFSDSIIISFVYTEPSALFSEIFFLLHLQLILFGKYGVLLRGACALGNAIHTNDYVFGPAINNAYLLENHCAIYPRIIISPDIIEECACFSIHKDYNDKKDILSLLKKDFDGFYYIDYLGIDTIGGEIGSFKGLEKYTNNIQEFIINGLKNNDANIKQKYLWLKEKYNNSYNNNKIE